MTRYGGYSMRWRTEFLHPTRPDQSVSITGVFTFRMPSFNTGSGCPPVCPGARGYAAYTALTSRLLPTLTRTTRFVPHGLPNFLPRAQHFPAFCRCGPVRHHIRVLFPLRCLPIPVPYLTAVEWLTYLLPPFALDAAVYTPLPCADRPLPHTHTFGTHQRTLDHHCGAAPPLRTWLTGIQFCTALPYGLWVR